MNKKALIQQNLEKTHLKSKQTLYDGKIIKLSLESYELETGKKIAEVIHHPGAVVILPIDSEGRILLIEQWRRAAQEILLELPAGTLEKNESPIECAKRELQEETGFAARKIIPFGGFFSAPGFCTEYLHLFLASDLYASPLPHDDDEMIDLVPTPPELAKKWICENKIRDAKTVAGILKYLCENGS